MKKSSNQTYTSGIPVGLKPYLSIITFISLFLLSTTTFAQPNDDCNNATPVPAIDGSCNPFTTTGASFDLFNGDCTAGTNNTWFSFVAQGPDLIVQAAGGTFVPEITVVQFNPTPCDFGSATQLGCSVINELGVNGLIPGNTYYILITPSDNVGGAFNLCVNNPLPPVGPPNDDACNAIALNANGSCQTGTTVDATIDYVNPDPACTAATNENAVWYTVTLSGANNGLDVNLISLGLTGDVGVLIGTLNPCNATTMLINEAYCGPPTTVTASGLTIGETYYIQVSSSDADAGNFQICATETGPPPGCSINNFCNQAETITIVSNQACNAVSGCNIGASPEPSLGGCSMATEEVVWYTFTSDANAGLLSLSITSPDIVAPTVQVFTGACNGLADISGCVTGSNNQVAIVNQSIAPNTTYFLAVSNDFGPGGNFNLCALTFDDISACVTQSALYVQPGSTSNGSPDNGPYTPGESVTLCFDLINYHADPIGQGNNCQWLQGIVPVFGDCWDMSAFNPLASTPPSVYGGNWGWYTDITYNVGSTTLTIDDCDGDGDTDICHITEPNCCNTGTTNGQIVPPGWFANMGGGSPNNTFGDGNCCNCDMGPWSFCFTLTTKMYPDCDADPSFSDCTVKIYTFADGQTGSWNGGSSICGQDISQIQTASLNCCEGPEADFITQSICDGSSTSIALTSSTDPTATFEWTVTPDPHPTGATAGSGNFITQILNNPGSTPITVNYEVIATSQSGCPGLPVLIPVTVLPELTAQIPPAAPVCSGSCTNLSVIPSGGSPPYLYEWSNTDMSPVTQVCPVVTTDYTVTVTDFVGCSTTATVTVNANSNILVDIDANPGNVICQNDPNSPISLIATAADGDGNYSYEWFSLCGGTQFGQFINVPASCFGTNTFSVTVTDGNSCTGVEQIDITVNPPITPIFIIPPPTVCVNAPDFNLNASVAPSGGYWSGVANSFDGNISPNVLGVGVYDVTYIYETPELCVDSTTIQLTITDAPDITSAMDASACLTYTLPAITGTNLTGNQAYYTGLGGTGTMYNPGDVITATTTLYAYDDDGSGSCGDEETIVITITPAPQVDDLMDVTACNTYTLPTITGTNLTGNEAYYLGTLASGLSFNPGDVISATTTLFIFDGDNMTNCNGEESFTITIAPPPDVNDIADLTACATYTLPAITGTNLTTNEAYYTATGGTGTMYNAGDVITTTTTLFIFDDDGSGACGDEESFTITITPTPVVDDIADLTACDTYTLVAITGTNLSGNEGYFTGPGGTGTAFNVGDAITTTTTLYIFDDAGVAACTSEEEFTITIVPPPVVDDITDVTACNTYTLPNITGANLSGNEAYFTGTNGSGTSYNAGDAITTTTTLYIFDDAGLVGCTSEEEFTVTIIPPPVVDDITDLTACDTYPLPNITGTNLSGNEAYFTGTNGSGTSYNAGDAITTTTTLYIFDDAGLVGCTSEEAFTVTIVPPPVVDDLTDVTACNTYTLPNITGANLSGNEAYFTGTNGSGTSYDPGDAITTTTTLYIFDDSGLVGCTSEEAFTITIVAPPVVDDITDVTACNTYTLPNITGANLSGNEAYFTGTNGSGTSYDPGDAITSTTTLYIFDDAGLVGCTSEEAFTITIIPPPVVDDLTDVTACNTYTLPNITGANLSGNEAYFTGTNGSGTSYDPGDAITSTTTLFIFDDAGVAGCTSEEAFTITIVPPPVVDDLSDVTVCNTYTLPAITGTNLSGNEAYYTGTNGSGTSYNAGDAITTTTTLFIYDDAGLVGCTSEEAFTVTIIPAPIVDDLSDVTACNTYTLPNITGVNLSGNEAYYTGTNGGGTSYSAGDAITTTTTLYIYDNAGVAGCTSEEEFTITIVPPPVVDDLTDVTVCDTYTLPAITGTNLSGNEAYFTGTNGSGTSYNTGDAITTTTTIFIYDNAGLVGCTSEEEFIVTIVPAPVINDLPDVTACDSYTLPAITGTNLSGNEAYYTGTNGTGASYNAGDAINTTTTIYIYDDAGITNCNHEQDFVVTIVPAPIINDIADVSVCDSYTLPAITGLNLSGNEAYYDGTGGTGTSYNAGDIITSSTLLYIYDSAALGCEDEQDLDITINATPTADFTVDPTICVTGMTTVTYTGSAGVGATYTWNFNGGTIISGTGAGPYEIQWAAAGNYNVSLSVEENTCNSATNTEAVQVDPVLPTPIINCDPTTSSVTFTWTEDPAVDSYTVTDITGPAGILSGNTYTVSGLVTGQVVTIEVTAVGTSACGNSSNQESCTAANCPMVDINIDAVAPICLDNNATTIGLNAVVVGAAGGGIAEWSGTGITDPVAGTFDPTVAGVGTHQITFTLTEDNCVYNASINIVVNAQPTSDFIVDPVICVSNTANISYTGSASATAIYSWDFDGGTIVSGAGAGPYEITWATSGNYNVTLTVEENACLSTETLLGIQVDPVVPTPMVTCAATTNSVTFTWTEVPGVDSYTVTDITGPAGVFSGNTYTVSGLSTGQTVVIDVTANSSSSCGNATLQAYSCTASDCPPITVSVDMVNDICLDGNAMAINLVANVMGSAGTGTGVWSGTGITDAVAGTFDPTVAGANTHTITYTFTESNCTYSDNITIVVHPQPSSSFSVDPTICVTNSSTISYTGSPGVTTIYNWDFDGGTVLSGTGAGPYEIQWATAGSYNVSLTVEENGCSSLLSTEAVQVDPELAAPNITCTSTTTSVTFTWDPVVGANSYTVSDITGPAGNLSGNSYTVSGLVTGQVVTIEVTAVGSGACGNSSMQESCTANNCPIVTVAIDAVADICLDGSVTAFDLTANINGGTMGTGNWTGTGITDATAGTFDPAIAGVGTHAITYTYTESSCSYTDMIDIVVNPQPIPAFTADPIICVTDNSTIAYTGFADPSATYNWDFAGGTIISGSGQGPYEINWATAGNYNVGLTVIENGCSSVFNSLTVQVDGELNLPMINCNSTTTSVIFTWPDVPGATSYTVTDITGPAGTLTGTTYTVDGLSTGQVVTIEVTAIGGSTCGNSIAQETCTADACPTVTVTVDPVPAICLTPMSPTLTMVGTIMGGTNGTASWSGPGITDATTGTFDPTVAGPGMHDIVYTYTETTCSYTDMTTIEVFATPTAEAGAGGELSCAVSTIVLDGSSSSAGNYSWTTNGGNFVMGQNTTTPEIDGSGTYYLTVESNGCTATDSVVITQDPLSPVADAGVAQAIDCNTLCVTLGGPSTSVGPQYTYSWTGPNGFTSSDQTPQVCEAGDYTLIVNDVVNTCSSPASTVTISDNTAPPVAVVVVVGNLDCFTTSLQLDGSSSSAGPNIVYQWYDQNGMILGANDPNFTALDEGDYTLIVQDVTTGCSSSAMETVQDLTDYPLAIIADPEELDCNTTTITLDATGSTNVPSITYSWSGPAGGLISGGDSNTPVVGLPGQYTITVIDVNNSCEQSADVIVTQDIVAPTADAGDDIELTCSESSATLGGTNTSTGAIYSYSWTNPGVVIDDATSLNPTVEELGTYTLTVSNIDNGCTATDEMILSENVDGPQANFTTTDPDCYGDRNGTISVESVSGGVAPYLYSFEGDTYSSLEFFSNLAAGNYEIGIQDANGCESSQVVSLDQPAQATLEIGDEVTLGLGDSIVLQPLTNILIDTIVWSPFDQLVCPDSAVCFNPVIYPTQSYTVFATVFDENGCSASDDLRVIVDKERLVFIPNGFSPDNDGVNDLFMIYGGKGVEKVNVFRVFNRWGEVIFEGENFLPGDPDYGWDGLFRNKKLNPGVFIYLAEIQFSDGEVILYKGDVTLLR